MSSLFDLDDKVAKLVERDSRLITHVSGGRSRQIIRSGSYIKSAKSDPVDQHEKILQSYIEVPRASWSTIPLKTYIRYKTNRNELKTGARIKSIDRESDDSYTIVLRKFSRGAKTLVWSINTKKISNIYKIKEEKKFQKKTKVKDGGISIGNSNSNKSNNATNTNNANMLNDGFDITEQPMSTLSQLGDKLLFDDMSTITTRMDMLEVKTQRIEQDLKKLFYLVKSMYDKRH